MHAVIKDYEKSIKFNYHKALFIDFNEEALFFFQGADPTTQ